MREAGASAVQEVAFTLANGREYVRRAIERGLDIDRFAPRLSFFFAAHNHLFEEVCKFRAARRLWARMIREEFEGSDRSCRLRFHTQTAGSTLTAQQPMNNVVRVTVQALAGVLGGTQSLHTNSYDEALALPGARAARLALRTQQVLAEESGVADTVDPLGGSFFVEALTDEIEQGALTYLERIEEEGGAAAAIPFMTEEIHRSAYAWQLEVESGERRVVGVNAYRDEESAPPVERPDFAGLQHQQRRRLAEVREARDEGRVAEKLRALEGAVTEGRNLLPPMVEAVKVRATLGEISSRLAGIWGTYRQV
jgi:methylmalonyl-CoA mutase N-terminal domain/subunit